MKLCLIEHKKRQCTVNPREFSYLTEVLRATELEFLFIRVVCELFLIFVGFRFQSFFSLGTTRLLQ